MHHDAPVHELLRQLDCSEQGLSTAEATARLTRHGPNVLPESQRSMAALVAGQFRDPMVWILLVALGISLAAAMADDAGEGFVDSFVIGAILVLNAALGIAQEFQAERAIAALEKLQAPQARVRRDGREQLLPARELVPGDVVVLEAGDRLAADGRVLAAAALTVDESALTGEAMPVEKSPEPVAADAPLAERSCLVHAGTLVTGGGGTVLVTSTGLNTETGRIAAMVARTELPQTPLQRRLAQLGRTLGAVALAMCGAVVLIGWWRAWPLLDIGLVGISLAVSAVPEGLPAVVTVCFALGVRRMAAHRALVRRLDALETLGAVTVICTDKTGTLTQNQMTVVANEAQHERLLARALASCNHAALPDLGDPTELALVRWAAELGVEPLPIDEETEPFSSERKRMQTRHGEVLWTKGSLEALLADAGPSPALQRAATGMAAQGLRVLAAMETRDGVHRMLGLVGLADPPREGVADAVADAHRAGIRTVMITGDDPVTAQAIGAQVGIAGPTFTGRDLDAMDAAALDAAVAEGAVFARVSPAHKVLLCEALQARGEVVSMSGDGVNDAPALKRAHVGVAMGLRGTDVAREAAAIVLADDHFATIVGAVREGRRIHDNIRKFVLFLLRANFDELALILTTVALELPLPLLPVHILWVNLATDGLPALALAAEPAEPDVMDRPPRDPKQGLLHGAWGKLLLTASGSYGLVLGFFLSERAAGVPLDEVRAGTLTLVIALELVQALSSRSDQPLWRVGLRSNPWLLAAVLGVWALHLALVLTPAGALLHLVPLSSGTWLEVAGLTALGLGLFEGLKLLRR